MITKKSKHLTKKTPKNFIAGSIKSFKFFKILLKLGSPINNTLVNNLEEIVRWPQESNRWKSKHSIGEVWESLQTTMQARRQCKERRKDQVGRSRTAAHGSKKDSVKQTGKFSRQKTPASCWSGPAFPPTLCSVFSLGTSGPCESMVVGPERKGWGCVHSL